MNQALFTGVCTALVTPFIGNQINYPMMGQLIRQQIDAGIPAIVVAGTTGEAPTLKDEEKMQLFRYSKACAGDACLVIAGTGTNDTRHAVELSQAAEEAGADALLVVTPYYNKATPEGLFAHYLSIAHAVSLPIILYNVPSRTSVDIPVSVYKRLSGVPNIVGVKEASKDITKVARILRECDPDFSVWSGNDDLTVPVISLGGKGVISVLSNVFPEETAVMAEAALRGDFKVAASMQQELMPLIDALFCEVNPIPVKAVLQHLGYDCGGCRLPLTTLSQENQEKIRAIFG